MPYHRDEEYLNTLFEYAPISLWEQDFSQIKKMFDELRGRGIVSLDSYLTQHPDFVLECMQQIRVVNVNKKTVSMCAAGSKEELLENLDRVFRDGMRHHFRAELLALWNEDVSWSGEGLNYTLKGDAINIRLHWRILPEFEQAGSVCWSLWRMSQQCGRQNEDSNPCSKPHRSRCGRKITVPSRRISICCGQTG